jgi:hypothetical protein
VRIALLRAVALAISVGACSAPGFASPDPGESGAVAPVAPAAPATTGTADDHPRLEVGSHEGVPWPLVLAPVDGPLPHAPEPEGPPPDPPTNAGVKVMEVLGAIQTSLVESSYQHSTKVRADDGVYHWDCSGMTAWILRRAAPRALRALNRERPVARDFASIIERAPTDKAKKGWQRIDNIADVMPGDVFAWRRPRGLPSKNTGHVGIVVDRPMAVPGIPGGWVVRIADSTSNGHQNDTRRDDPDGGFGIGLIAFLADADGRATHYGWGGTRSEVYVVTPVVFGRVSK